MNPAPHSVAESVVAFKADDGFPLEGTLYSGQGNGPLVLISSAAAVPRRLYAGFARKIVAAGARASLTYDYRGTAGSARPAGWKARINMKDWAVRDFVAAAGKLDEAAPGHPMAGVGQSYGGQALGLSGIAHRFERYAMVASMSGYHGDLADRSVWYRMNLVGLPVSLACRDMPRWLGIGEPIATSTFRDWARWCRMKNYFFDDPNVPETARFKDVALPLLAFGMTDDPWGTPAAVHGLMRHYTNATVETRWLSPQDGGGPIGHLGFFRAHFAETLWPPLADWLLDGRPVSIGTCG
ncbi:hypothetical protein PZ895_09040 [Mesorhizobium sp. YIM 152430]|uniref:alpha/beta hydrolase family protein n=1 Tax=Mesorhizobium sp. YIM 152430 TaxID=3031761 RepID=UPI0023DA899D|nr:hypothetical protein [Mesorhizobium sp. YIM 152430]MDF1599923.1 hypothetical protein [Mesorhizobium sp. YIM 152430]